MNFTENQQRVLDARDHNILVSAAAGSGKTAVLVERIVRLVTEPAKDTGVPADIDQLLVVTFTRAAAAQMRERIGAAIEKRLAQDPENRHLQRQETLLHRAQITTIDSFCTYLLRNHFSDIDLDPSFRQADETESALLKKDVLGEVLEEAYSRRDPAFMACVDYFCPGLGDTALESLVMDLYTRAMSHPWPEAWLAEREADYGTLTEKELYRTPWMDFLHQQALRRLKEMEEQYDAMIVISTQPGGPYPYTEFLEEEKKTIFACLHEQEYTLTEEETDPEKEPVTAPHPVYKPSVYGNTEIDPWVEKAMGSAAEAMKSRDSLSEGVDIRGQLRDCIEAFAAVKNLPRVDARKYPDVDPLLKSAVQEMRSTCKKSAKALGEKIFGEFTSQTIIKMEAAREPLVTLVQLTLDFLHRFHETKQEKNLIDFDDLEHYALEILCSRKEDGSVEPSKTALRYRSYFKEILIDEYQDSNDVQELLLSTISGESEGHFNRFMVGDVKQSIYKFRLARPEIFMEKFALYQPMDPRTERIDLDQNFRSRQEVLESVNRTFERIMRQEIGGIDYDFTVSLKKGADYPQSEEGVYQAELLLVDEKEEEKEDQDTAGKEAGTNRQSAETGGTDGDGEAQEQEKRTNRQKQALAVAHRIKELVGILPVRDEDSGLMRPARYKDIVILLRAASGWDEELRAVFEKEGIPSYINTRTGYFAAEEIRQALQLLRVLDNPRQDIPLYGVMRGYFGDFSEDEVARVRLCAVKEEQQRREAAAQEERRENCEENSKENSKAGSREKLSLYEALQLCAAGEDPLGEKAAAFLAFIRTWRERKVFLTVHTLLTSLFEETGYEHYAAALPGGAGRLANLHMLCAQAAAFEKTAYTGLFQFLRYIDQMHAYEVDYGEANTLDEEADVVRIMSIHKSKGLEFPICFVVGMEKRFNRRDASGDMLIDNDWGVGLSYVDPARRIRTDTLRKKAIAEKIRQDSLGEELRILYVAMTRAKEKLILTGYTKDCAGKIEQLRASLSGLRRRHLPVTAIENASCFLDLLLAAQAASEEQKTPIPFAMNIVKASEISLQELEDQVSLETRARLLQHIREEAREGHFADENLAGELQRRFAFRYPHENLASLYTKTTVTELKKAAEGEWEEESHVLFAEKESLPSVPRFIQEKAEKTEGAARGTVIHHFLEVFDYGRFAALSDVTQTQLAEYAGELIQEGLFREEEKEILTEKSVLRFLKSPLAARMAAAEREGRLYREQHFVMGVPANRLREDFPAEEEVLIQGVIDAFFEEGDRIVLVDYKTDRVDSAGVLLQRYRVQLSCYAEAIARMRGRRVTEKIIYSTALGQEILLPE